MPRLGLDFLRRLGPRSHASDLPAWFENLLPEKGSELRTRLCALYDLRDGQSFALLLALGRDLTGAVEVVDASEVGEASVPPNNDEWSTTHKDRDPGLLGIESGFAALAGMQLKFSMSMVNERLVLPARSGRSQWIVKLAGRDYDELAEVETATMTWARGAGFDVPNHFTVPFTQLDGIPTGWASRPVPAFAIQRFDRRDDGSKVHQEDLCQALDLRPSNKYGDRGPYVSYDAALRLVKDACGERDGREMARRLGFMVACGNTDAHLKNWSLLWGERMRPTLAPCYDLVTTIAWEALGWQRPKGPELALSLGGIDRFSRLDDAALDTFVTSSGSPWAKDEFLEGITQAHSAWPSVASLAPLRMQEALAQHWCRVPILSSFGPLPSI